MSAEAEEHLVAVLSRIVQEARQLQATGRLRDPVSCSEVALLEQELRVLQARLAVAGSSEQPADGARASAVISWARALTAASEVARGHSRRVRKDLYRTRLIRGPE